MNKNLVMVVMVGLMAACGGSSSNNGSGSESTACVQGTGTSQTCSAEKNLDSAAKSAEANACSAGSGTVMDSCPTTGLDGCCTESNTSNAIKVETCYYQNDATDEQTACTGAGGTWATSN